MRLSVVSTLYNSAPFLREFYERARAAAEVVAGDFELVLVNDGSPDSSLRLALSLREQDPRVRVVDLARNFGHHRAIMTGLAHARGERVFLVDCDLEEDPALLVEFWKRMDESRVDAVYGVQQRRKGGFFERVSGGLFYTLFNLLSADPIPANLLTVRLMTRRYVRSLLEHREREVFLAGIWAITGYEQAAVPVGKLHRGESNYTLRRKLSLLVNSITSFSNRPLVFIFYLGCFIILVSGAAALYLVARKLLFGTLLLGWASLIASIWLLGGLTIFCLGIIGIYLSKLFTEAKQRPYTIIRQLYDEGE